MSYRRDLTGTIKIKKNKRMKRKKLSDDAEFSIIVGLTVFGLGWGCLIVLFFIHMVSFAGGYLLGAFVAIGLISYLTAKINYEYTIKDYKSYKLGK